MNDFIKSLLEDNLCPKCGESVIHIHGSGWDWDRKHCSKCDYEVEYQTTTYSGDE